MSLITREDVLKYTSIVKISSRGEKLDNDILRAEKKVFAICNHDFTGLDSSTQLPTYPNIPEEVKLATILWAEYFALKEIWKESAGLKSESLEGYSYTKANNTSIEEPDTYLLLKDHFKDSRESSKSKVFLRLGAI